MPFVLRSSVMNFDFTVILKGHNKHLRSDGCGDANKKTTTPAWWSCQRFSAHGSPMARFGSQWDDDDPSCGEQAATPHPISVYPKSIDCQVKVIKISQLAQRFFHPDQRRCPNVRRRHSDNAEAIFLKVDRGWGACHRSQGAEPAS